MCVILLVCSTVILDTGLSRANSFDDEISLDTENVDTVENAAETGSTEEYPQEISQDSSEVNVDFEEDFTDTPAETVQEENLEAAEEAADFSAGDDEETVQPETVTYTKLINNDIVEVKAEAEAGTLPEGAELNVTPVEKETEHIVKWIKSFFEANGKDCKAVLGISGGKDSSVAAALCVKALGKDRVFGVLMPDRKQDDIDVSHA